MLLSPKTRRNNTEAYQGDEPMSTLQREFVLAVRVPRNYVEDLDQLVERQVFENRSAALRRAILNLLNETQAGEIRTVEPTVNRVNGHDSIPELIAEVKALQSK